MITHKVSCPIIISAQSSFSSKDLPIFNKSSPLFQNIPTFTFNLPQKLINFKNIVLNPTKSIYNYHSSQMDGEVLEMPVCSISNKVYKALGL